MERLNPAELTCLQHLSRQESPERHCPAAVLQRLQLRGLIAEQPVRWLPLENRASDYTLTAAGLYMLRRHAERG